MARFNKLVALAAVAVLVSAATWVVQAQPASGGSVNTLTQAEQAAGWRLLFDGKTTKGWRGFKKTEFPKSGWTVEAGRLRHAPSGGAPTATSGGDIITVDTFNDFEFTFEWIVAAGGNSGVKYLVTEDRDGPIAHEYQIIDDVKHPDALIGPHRQTAALYDAIPSPATKRLKPAGQLHQGRIIVNGNHVEHWLNGAKVIEYELGSAALKAAKAKSKFKDVAGWGEKIRGHLLLQDHGDEIWYQNLKIREISATSTKR